jgi:RimJ/RimL family protein N-acetyltransferase
MSIPTITTARLSLRPFRDEDAEPLHRILSEEGMLRYFPNPDPPDLERVRRFVARQSAHWEEHVYGWWAVEPPGGPELIGWNGLTYLPETGETEVAYLLARPYWGHGLTTEAARASLRFGFEVHGLDPIIALVHPENARSIRVIEKLGMAFTRRAEYFGMELLRYILDRAAFGSARPAGEA